MLYYLDLFVNNLLLIKIDHIFLKDLTLIKIKDKKIAKYLEDVDSIKQELGL